MARERFVTRRFNALMDTLKVAVQENNLELARLIFNELLGAFSVIPDLLLSVQECFCPT